MTAPDPAVEQATDQWATELERIGEVLNKKWLGDTLGVVLGRSKGSPSSFPIPPPLSSVRVAFTEGWILRDVDWSRHEEFRRREASQLIFQMRPPRGQLSFADTTPAYARFVGSYGTFHVPNDVPLESPTCGYSAKDAPTFVLDSSRKVISNARGFVKLKLSSDHAGVFKGDPDAGASLVGLFGLNPDSLLGELENIDIFSLPYDQLTQLGRVRRLRPFWPRSADGRGRDREKAVERALGMDMGTEDSVLRESRRTEFWDRFVASLKTQHPGGENLAIAREISYEVRRNSHITNSRTEAVLLWIGSLFRYGTRVDRPAKIWAVVALAGALALTLLSTDIVQPFESATFLALIFDLLVSPVTFVRSPESEILVRLTEQGVWQRIVLFVVRLLGATCIAFGAVAVSTYIRYSDR